MKTNKVVYYRWIPIIFCIVFWACVFSCLTGCKDYQHEFLSDCERVNAETIKCDVCGYDYLADFPVKEDKVQIKTRVSYTEGTGNARIVFWYGGEWDRVHIPVEQGKFLYECVTEQLEDEWYDDDVYPDVTSPTTTEDIVERIKQIKEKVGTTPKTTTAIEPKETKELDWRAMP